MGEGSREKKKKKKRLERLGQGAGGVVVYSF